MYTIKDDGLSPVAYTGTMTGADIDIVERTNSYDDILRLNFKTGKLSPPFDNSTRANSWRAVIDWHHDYTFRETEINTSYLGWNFIISYTEAEHNSYSNNPKKYTGFASLGPSYKYDYKLPLGNDHWKLELLTSVSLLNYIIRPSISAWEPIGYDDKVGNRPFETLITGKVKTINKFQRIFMGIHLNYFTGEHFAIYASYSWDFIHYNENNSLFDVHHEFMTGILFKL